MQRTTRQTINGILLTLPFGTYEIILYVLQALIDIENASWYSFCACFFMYPDVFLPSLDKHNFKNAIYIYL